MLQFIECRTKPTSLAKSSLSQSPALAPNPSCSAQLSPRTKQPARTLWVSFAPAALNRRPRFRPAMVRPKTKKWSALIFADHALTPISYLISHIHHHFHCTKPSGQYAPPSRLHSRYPTQTFYLLRFHYNFTPDILYKRYVCSILHQIPLQMHSTYVTSDAFSRQFCYRNHLPVLCQHRYICVFGERRASLHLYID